MISLGSARQTKGFGIPLRIAQTRTCDDRMGIPYGLFRLI